MELCVCVCVCVSDKQPNNYVAERVVCLLVPTPQFIVHILQSIMVQAIKTVKFISECALLAYLHQNSSEEK